jgi:hypothetical protein
MTKSIQRVSKRERAPGTGVRLHILPMLAFTAAVVLVPPATASLLASYVLSPGTTCLPPDDMNDMPGTLLATQLDPFSFTTSSGITHGAIKTEVFRETAGTLDFYYIVFNAPDSATSLMRETDLNFSGWATSVAFRSDGSNVPGFVNGNVPPPRRIGTHRDQLWSSTSAACPQTNGHGWP